MKNQKSNMMAKKPGSSAALSPKKTGVSSVQIYNLLKAIQKQINTLEKNQKNLDVKLDRLLEISAPQLKSEQKQQKVKNKTVVSLNNEALPIKTREKIKKIETFLDKYWKYFLPKQSSKEEKIKIIKLIKHPVFKSFQKIEQQLIKNENNQLWASSANEIEQKLNHIITNEIFEGLEMKFTEIVYFHQQLGSNRAKSEKELEEIKSKLMAYFGIEKIPVQIGEDTFNKETHVEFEKQNDDTRQDGAILSVLNDGYLYPETLDILKKVEVTVNYR